MKTSPTTTPIIADLYLRLSDLRLSDVADDGTTSLDYKEKLLRQRADQLGWTVARVVVENDLTGDGNVKPASAFKRQRVKNRDGSWAQTPDGRPVYRVHRPGFRAMLNDLCDGKAQAVIAEDLDRTFRDPRDLEDFIDVCEAYKVNARSLSGSLTFTDGGTDSEITMARNMVSFANKSSRDTARRVAQARERRAASGRNGGGRRPYGFRSVDGALTIDKAEAAVLRRAAEAVLAAPVSHAALSNLAQGHEAVTLKALARDLRDKKVPTVTGKAWSADTLRGALVKPMVAGLSIHHGQEVVVPEPRPDWMVHPILTPDVWHAVVAKLEDPARRSSTGNAPKWLGSGIYLCGRDDCGAVCHVSGSGNKAPRYVCSAHQHLGRVAQALDAFVEAHLLTWLSQPEAARLLAPVAPGVDAPALRRALKVHQGRLTEIAEDYDADRITRAQMLTQTASRRAKITKIEDQLGAATERDPLAGIAGNPDAAGVWETLTLEQRREVLRRVLSVTLLPTGRGRGFKPESVRIDPL